MKIDERVISFRDKEGGNRMNEQFLNRVLHGDCLEWLPQIEDKSIDMICCDLPYGTTNRNKWDVIIPFDELWKEYKRVIKDNGAILLFADEPFTSQLIMSNGKWFKQRITWDKDRGSGFLNAKKMLLKQTEDIVLFYKKPPTYNPQMVDAKPDRIRPSNKGSNGSTNYGEVSKTKSADDYDNTKRYPTNLMKFSSWSGECNSVNRLHPTQKPIELIDWLLKTYSNEGDTILDNCGGSGTTAVSCIRNNRNFILMEKEWDYCEVSNERIKKAREQVGQETFRTN